MKGGHNKKATAVRRLEGNPGRRPFNAGEPQIPVGAPIMPRQLKNGARAEWRKLSKGMAAAGMLTPLDGGIFASYCIAYAIMMQAQEEGDSNLAIKAMAAMRMAAGELGLTPVSRSRLVVNAEEKPADKWAEIIPN